MGPINVPGGPILIPMFAAHPYNHFCTEYPPPPGSGPSLKWNKVYSISRIDVYIDQIFAVFRMLNIIRSGL